MEDRLVQIHDPSNAILSALEQLGREVRGGDDAAYQYAPYGQTASVSIPEELVDNLNVISQSLLSDSPTIPLDRGVSAAVSFFTRVTKVPMQPRNSGVMYLDAILSLMKTLWLLGDVKARCVYQITAQYYLPSPLEQQLTQWGMTLDRFFLKFEEVNTEPLSPGWQDTHLVLLTDYSRRVQTPSRTSVASSSNTGFARRFRHGHEGT